MRLPSHPARRMVLGGMGLLVVVARAQAPDTAKTPAKTPAKAAAGAPPATEDPREKPARDLMRAFSQAYNAADAKALAGLFVDSASVVDPSGGETRGKPAIGEMYAASHRDAPGLKLESEIARVRFLTPDVARLEGRSRVASPT